MVSTQRNGNTVHKYKPHKPFPQYSTKKAIRIGSRREKLIAYFQHYFAIGGLLSTCHFHRLHNYNYSSIKNVFQIFVKKYKNG
jgi:hypothetical protein